METIICAAIWWINYPVITNINSARPINCNTGIVFCGHRHHNCLHLMCSITGKNDYEMGKSIQGFLTNKNRFVDRIEGLTIALNANQILDISDIRGNRLHSEDLY